MSASLTDGTDTFDATSSGASVAPAGFSPVSASPTTAQIPTAPIQPAPVAPLVSAPVPPKPQQVTLGNGQVVNVDSAGNFTDANGQPVSGGTVAGSKAPTASSTASQPLSPTGTQQTPYNTVQVPSGQQNTSGTLAPSAAAGVNQGAAPAGSQQSSNGNWVDSNGNQYTQAPGSTSATTGTTPSTGNASVDALVDSQNALAAAAQKVSDTITGISNGSIPLSASDQAQITGLQQQYQQLISQQQQFNTGAEGTANIRGYQTGSAEYDPTFQVKTIGAIVSAGATKVANLQTQEATAVAQLTQALKTNDINAVKDAYSAYKDANSATQDALKTTIADTQGAINDAHIANVISSGITSPAAILATLQKQGYTDISSTDITNAIKNLSPDASNIYDIQKSAAANGAPADVLAAIGKATDTTAAFAAAAGYTQTLTGDLADYKQYTKDAAVAGVQPLSYTDWENKQTYTKAYETAAGTAAGKATVSTDGSGTVDLTSLSPAAQQMLQSSGFTGKSTDTQSLAIQLVDGQIAPSELSKRTTGDSSYSDILTAANQYSLATTGKAFNIATADRDYKFSVNTNTQNTLNFLGSLLGTDDGAGNLTGGNLGQLIDSANALGKPGVIPGTGGVPMAGGLPSSFPALNNAAAWLKLSTGNPQIAAYYATLTETSDQIAKILQGGGAGGTSDAKLAQASALFQKGFTPAQVTAVASSLQGLLLNRAKSMIGDNAYLSDYADQFGLSDNNGSGTGNPVVDSQLNNPLNLTGGSTDSSSNPLGI